MLVKISPVKILSDLGYELVELETPEDYLSALMEAIVSLQGDGGSGRARADILQEELITLLNPGQMQFLHSAEKDIKFQQLISKNYLNL